MGVRADYIFMAQVLLHIPDVEGTLAKLYEALHPGGHAIIVDFNKNEEIVSDLVHPGFDQGALADLMGRIGYKDIQSKTFYTGKGRDDSLLMLDARK